MSDSAFKNLNKAPPIEVFQLNRLYAEDSFERKVNLGVGAYKDEHGQPWVLPVVRKVEKSIASDETLNHEYLPILGLDSFTKCATELLLGNNSIAFKEGRAFGIQALSGTGGLRVVAEFLCTQLGYKNFYYSLPTWENHSLIFQNAGFNIGRKYRYWDPLWKGLDISGLTEDLMNAPENSVIILHSCAHNPTGCDPTQVQWKRIAEIIKKKKLFPLFDAAYQGFASGDPDKDAWAVRYFVEQGFELICTQSFAKNFGLYNERIGNITFVTNNTEVVANMKSQLTIIVRGMYSNPPNHGARIVSTILNNPQLYNEWLECITIMSSRIREMRQLLRSKLEKLGTPGSWEHITEQIGMFSYTGLSPEQSKYLISKHHIYLLTSGRISMCGLNKVNVGYVAESIKDAIINCPSNNN